MREERVGRPERRTSGALVVASLAAGIVLLGGCSGGGDEPNYGDHVASAYDRGKASGARGDLQTISRAVMDYTTHEGDLPTATGVQGLASLLEPRYVRRLPRRDPWGTRYDYEVDGGSFTVRSAGHDQEFGTEDDLVLTDGQVVQLPPGLDRR